MQSPYCQRGTTSPSRAPYSGCCSLTRARPAGGAQKARNRTSSDKGLRVGVPGPRLPCCLSGVRKSSCEAGAGAAVCSVCSGSSSTNVVASGRCAVITPLEHPCGVHVPLPVAPHRCGAHGHGCGADVDAHGNHHAACPRTGLLANEQSRSSTHGRASHARLLERKAKSCHNSGWRTRLPRSCLRGHATR